MSAPVRVLSDERNIELGTAVNWRLIAAASGLAAAVVVAVGALALLAPTAPQKEPAVARRYAAAPDDDLVIPALPQSHARPQPHPVESQPVVVQAAPEKPKPAPKPVVVASKPVPPPPPAPVVETKPVRVEPTKIVKATLEPSLKRRSPYGEAQLLEKLINESRELDIETEKGTTAKLLADSAKSAKDTSREKDEAKAKKKTAPVVEMIAKRDDLKGLPLRDLDKCQVAEKEGKLMADMSRQVRAGTAKLTGRAETSQSYGMKMKYDREMSAYMDKCLKAEQWREEVGVRMTVQMFQTEDEVLRTKMVKILADSKDKTASVAIARRAVFDLHPDVRVDAILALKNRPAAEYRPMLVEALRYPWAPVADNAAAALVALDDRGAVEDLVALLDKPDPQVPFQNKDKKWVAPELVRVNHLGNCVLCHAPCSASEGTVRGLVPERDKPLPVVYYESAKGSFVRADVTYLKQDFSVMQYVAEPKKWPALQRFDYLIRQRELTADEVKALPSGKDAPDPTAYPQREAVLWALRELTGVDAGSRTDDWKHYLECKKKQQTVLEP